MHPTTSHQQNQIQNEQKPLQKEEMTTRLSVYNIDLIFERSIHSIWHPNTIDFHWYYQGRFHLCKVSRRCWMFLHLRRAGQSYWDASPWRFPSEHPLLLTKKPSEVFEVLKWKKNTKLLFQSRRGRWYVCVCVCVCGLSFALWSYKRNIDLPKQYSPSQRIN